MMIFLRSSAVMVEIVSVSNILTVTDDVLVSLGYYESETE